MKKERNVRASIEHQIARARQVLRKEMVHLILLAGAAATVWGLNIAGFIQISNQDANHVPLPPTPAGGSQIPCADGDSAATWEEFQVGQSEIVASNFARQGQFATVGGTVLVRRLNSPTFVPRPPSTDGSAWSIGPIDSSCPVRPLQSR